MLSGFVIVKETGFFGKKVNDVNCNETNFIKRLKKQKEDALEYIIDRYSPFVSAICFRILSGISNEAVYECVNDVFLSVWQSAAQFDGEPEDFKKWIGTMAKHKAIDRFRQLDKLRMREAGDESLRQQATDEDAQKKLLRKEDKHALLLAMSAMKELDRDIFILKYFHSLSNSEIAEALKLTVPAVENRLYRGKKKLSSSVELKERFI